MRAAALTLNPLDTGRRGTGVGNANGCDIGEAGEGGGGKDVHRGDGVRELPWVVSEFASTDCSTSAGTD